VKRVVDAVSALVPYKLKEIEGECERPLALTNKEVSLALRIVLRDPMELIR
jgi:hypothetical protein